jgi:hypothetical protein
MFCCVNKKILTSVIEPSPAFQPKKDRFLLTNPHPMAELIKALQPLKPLKSNPLNDSAKPVNNKNSK